MLVLLLQGPEPDRQALSRRIAVAGTNGDDFCIPFVCLGETWRTLTEPRGYGVPPEAVELLLRRLMRNFRPLVPTSPSLENWLRLAGQLKPRGAEVFDVQVAALCVDHRVAEIWTFDRSFPALRDLKIVHPLEA